MTGSTRHPSPWMPLDTHFEGEGPVVCFEREPHCIISSRRLDDEIEPLIGQFITNIGFHIDALWRAMDQDNLTALRNTCRLLRGAGRSYGYESITQTAAAALDALATPRPDPAAVEQSITTLIAILTRIRR